MKIVWRKIREMKTLSKTFTAEISIISYDDPELVNDESVINTKKKGKCIFTQNKVIEQLGLMEY
jgi:hypothetical protein